MKIAIHTSALGSIHSGGIRCIVYFLNILKKRGYDVCAFVDIPPYNSTWLPSNFEVFSSNSEKYLNFDGVLISPYSPTAKKVSEHKKASHKIYWVHTFEGAFEHSGRQFIDEAIKSYRLNNIYFMTTSNYVTTFLNLIFKQNVLPHRVHGGIDLNIFKFNEDIYNKKMKSDKIRFCMLNRPEPLRGIKIGLQAFDMLKEKFGNAVEMELFAGLPQDEMYKTYGSAHFFIDPSLVAGLSLPPIESMACGTPTISTIFGSMDYLQNGVNGFFINSNDVKHTYQIIKKCTEIFVDEISGNSLFYTLMSNRAKKTALCLTWDKMVNNFEANLKYLI